MTGHKERKQHHHNLVLKENRCDVLCYARSTENPVLIDR